MDVKLRIFKAVANEKRMRLIKLLHERGRMSLGDIAVAMQIPSPTVCRNLKILENVGLVNSEINHAIAEYWLNRNKRLQINTKILDIILSE